MAFNTNFTAVVQGVDADTGEPALFVDGRSVPADDVEEIHVALHHAGRLLTSTVAKPGLVDWTAQFAQTEPGLAPGEDVFVVGVLKRSGIEDPVVWQGSFTVELKPR